MLWMAVVVFAATYLFAACIYWIVTRLAVNDRARAFKHPFRPAGWFHRCRGLG